MYRNAQPSNYLLFQLPIFPLQVKFTSLSKPSLSSHHWSLVELMLGNRFLADRSCLILSLVPSFIILWSIDICFLLLGANSFSWRCTKISSFDSTFINSSSLSSLRKSYREHYLVCLRELMFFLISATVSMKKFSIVELPSMNLVLKAISYRFCFFSSFICFCRRWYSGVSSGLNDSSVL